MMKTIELMKKTIYRVELLPQNCSYCNKKAKYSLKTGWFLVHTRFICEDHRIKILEKLDE